MFVGCFDFLSYLASRELEELDCGIIVLNSIAVRKRALSTITEHGFGRIALYLDHDQAGRETAEFFRRELGNRTVVDHSAQYAGFKDLNEWWVAVGKNRWRT